jgi:hypothetical protein
VRDPGPPDPSGDATRRQIGGSSMSNSVFAAFFYSTHKNLRGVLPRAAVLVLLYGCLTTLASTVSAQEGMFVPTGSMTTARYQQTATLLNNGQVLVAGGYGNTDSHSPSLASAELYDPTTGTFTPTGSMTTTRVGHTATLLNNGTVLLAGGQDVNGDAYSSAELYDPTTGTFTAIGSMTTTHGNQTATLLNNGTVLVTGGVNNAYAILSSAESYEPVVVSPASLSFSNQPAGTTSGEQTVTLTNNGSAALSIASIAISGTNASDFAEIDNCVGSVAAGASCSINVTFTPTAAGSGTGSVTIANNLTASPLAVPLSGTGIAATPIASLSASSLTFTSQMVGSTSAAQGLTFGNTGNAPLTISSLVVVGTNASDFAETDNCGGSVAAGASCTINVMFAPTATGTRTGTVNITDNATNQPSPQTVTLTGSGIGSATSTMLLSSWNPSAAGQLVTFMATVTSAATGTPTGTVTFLDGSTSIGTGTLNASGVATFTTFSLSVGFDSITAQYGGDTNFGSSTSAAYTQVTAVSFLPSSCSLFSVYMFGPACQSHPIPAPPFSVPGFILGEWSNLAYRSAMESLLGTF